MMWGDVVQNKIAPIIGHRRRNHSRMKFMPVGAGQARTAHSSSASRTHTTFDSTPDGDPLEVFKTEASTCTFSTGPNHGLLDLGLLDRIGSCSATNFPSPRGTERAAGLRQSGRRHRAGRPGADHRADTGRPLKVSKYATT